MAGRIQILVNPLEMVQQQQTRFQAKRKHNPGNLPAEFVDGPVGRDLGPRWPMWIGLISVGDRTCWQE